MRGHTGECFYTAACQVKVTQGPPSSNGPKVHVKSWGSELRVSRSSDGASMYFVVTGS